MPFDIYNTRAIDIDRNQPRIWENIKKDLKLHIEESERHPEKASESILSNFIFQVNTEKSSNTDETHYILRDLQQQIIGISKEIRSNSISKEKNKINSNKLTEFDYLLQKFLNKKPELSLSSLKEQIKQKKAKVGAGYLTDQGALFLLASDYGFTLSSLNQ